VNELRYRNYLRDLASLLREDARDARDQRDARKGQGDYAFYDGKLFAYYEVISTMLLQAKAFGLTPEELNLGEIDPEANLL
jgi:hypothetical protein